MSRAKTFSVPEMTEKEIIHTFFALRFYEPQNRAVKNATVKFEILLKHLRIEL